MFFFFFQAEDGIRGATVTGVQTCALPICPRAGKPVRILLTVDAHVRSAEELAERYGTEAPELPPAVPELPAGIELAAEAAGELVFWLPKHAALVAGDLVVGRDGGLWIPRPWMERGDRY